LLVAARGTVTVSWRRWSRASLGAALAFAAIVGMAVVAVSILAVPGEDEPGLASGDPTPPAAPGAGSAGAGASPAPGPGPGTSGEPVAAGGPFVAAASVEAASDTVEPAVAPVPGEDAAAVGATPTPESAPSGTSTTAPRPAGSTTTTTRPPSTTTTTQPPSGGVLADLLRALGLG
jgi:hypothetical protein